ncbi:MAG: DUF2807 domain-containing protein [Bacteroidales bacterium]
MKKQNFIKRFTPYILASLLFATSFANAQDITNRETSEFTGVDVGGVISVFLTQAPTFSVELETEGINPDDVITEVEDGILKIYYDDSFPKGAKITAKVTAPAFNNLIASGVANVKSTNKLSSEIFLLDVTGASKANLDLETEHLGSKVSGASNVYLTGKATVHSVDIGGASLMKAHELESDVVDVEASGAPKVEINAKSKITAKLSGTSSLIYEEKPEVIEISTSGLAKVGRISDGEVIFSDSKDTTKIKLKSQEVWLIDEDKDVKAAKKKRKAKFRNNWSGIDIGVNGYVNPEQSLRMKPGSEFLELEYNKSWALNFNLLYKSFPIIKNNLGIYTGLGFGFNNYRLNDKNVTLAYDPDGIDYVVEDEITMSRNKLVLSYLNIPLMLEVQTHGTRAYHRFHLAAGMNLGILMSSYTRQKYEVDGRTMKRKLNEYYHINPFKYEAVVRIGYSNINLFASYALNTLFKSNKGPEIYPFTVGISVN